MSTRCRPSITHNPIVFEMLPINYVHLLVRSSAGLQVFMAGLAVPGYIDPRAVALKEASGDYGSYLLGVELATANKLIHPHIVRYLGHGGDSARPTRVVMQLCSGSLHGKLFYDRLSESQVIRTLMQLFSAMNEFAMKNLVHRDLKPDNVLTIDHDGGVFDAVVGDLGLVVTTGHEEHASGTRGYMPPEVLNAKNHPKYIAADPSQDMFAVGVIALELCAKQGVHDTFGTVKAIERHAKDGSLFDTMASRGMLHPMNEKLVKLVKWLLHANPDMRAYADDGLHFLKQHTFTNDNGDMHWLREYKTHCFDALAAATDTASSSVVQQPAQQLSLSPSCFEWGPSGYAIPASASPNCLPPPASSLMHRHADNCNSGVGDSDAGTLYASRGPSDINMYPGCLHGRAVQYVPQPAAAACSSTSSDSDDSACGTMYASRGPSDINVHSGCVHGRLEQYVPAADVATSPQSDLTVIAPETPVRASDAERVKQCQVKVNTVPERVNDEEFLGLLARLNEY